MASDLPSAVLFACTGELSLPPGEYQVQVSAGPLRTIHRQAITVAAGEHASITAAIARSPAAICAAMFAATAG